MKISYLKLVIVFLLIKNLECIVKKEKGSFDDKQLLENEIQAEYPQVQNTEQTLSQKDPSAQFQGKFQQSKQSKKEDDKNVIYSDDYKLLSEEWEMKMSDFEPADLITIAIPARTEEVFGQEIKNAPSIVRGAWFVSSSDKEAINIEIRQKDTILFKKNEKKEGIFRFEAIKAGLYEIKLYNANFIEEVHVTFAIHAGNSSDELLEQKHLTPIEERLLDVDKVMKDLWVDIEFSEIRHESHFKTIADANKNIFLFTFLECVVIISLSAWQVFYIKRLLDNRVII